jgi:hypothetical protein
LTLVEQALSLPTQSLHSFLSEQHRLKLVHYPATDLGTGQGVGPHKDSSGWWTFLLQASPDVKGLQVLNKADQWVDVPPRPGTLVVNIGQAFEVITNGACPATTHRVLSGPRHFCMESMTLGARHSFEPRSEVIRPMGGSSTRKCSRSILTIKHTYSRYVGGEYRSICIYSHFCRPPMDIPTVRGQKSSTELDWCCEPCGFEGAPGAHTSACKL